MKKQPAEFSAGCYEIKPFNLFYPILSLLPLALFGCSGCFLRTCPITVKTVDSAAIPTQTANVNATDAKVMANSGIINIALSIPHIAITASNDIIKLMPTNIPSEVKHTNSLSFPCIPGGHKPSRLSKLFLNRFLMKKNAISAITPEPIR